MEEKNKKKEHYDRRLVIEIVKMVEEGVPRKELRERYSLGKKTLDNWMQKYGSELYHQNKRRVYSNKDKRSIAVAVEQGRMSVREACVAYGIQSEKLVRNWLGVFKREKLSFNVPTRTDMAKKKNAAENKTQASDLQKALEEAQLKIIALNTMIDVAEEQLKIEIRKKFGAKPSLD
jgi:transposase